MSPSLKTYLLQPRIIIAAAVVVAAVAIGWVFISTTPNTAASYVHPTQGPITEQVDTTGAVKAADSVDLAFEKSGRISYVSAKVGSHVSVGTTLASISSADLQAVVEQAQAALQVQQAKLDSVKTGTRPESVAVAQASVSGAQSGFSQTTQSLLSAAGNAYVASDDAIHNKIDVFFNNPRGSSPTLVFTLTDSQLQGSIQSDRLSIETLLTAWQTESAGATDASSAATVAQTNLARVGGYLDEIANGLTHVVPTTNYPSATIQGYQAGVATARSNIAAAINALNVAQTAQTSAASALASAKSSLALAQAPATSQDVAQQVAQVASAQANVDAAEAELGKAAIRAPFSGVVTVNNAHLGQIASPGSPLISMISDAQFQLEVYVSEADVAKVKAGNTAQVTLDAYQDQAPLPAHVVAVDPAATVQSGVSSYKVTLQFDGNNKRVQAGLTGNASIITQTKGSALQVPSSAIVRQGSGTFVLLSGASGDVLTPVQTGIVGANGMTEITGGISAGDSIRSFGTQQ